MTSSYLPLLHALSIDRLSSESRERRWRGVSAAEREHHAKRAVQARETKKRERRALILTELMEAHLPTWLKIKLLTLSGGRRDESGRTPRSAGPRAIAIWIALTWTATTCPEFGDRAFTKPSTTLRAIFANEAHPGAEFVDFIPAKRRRQFLRGLLWGAAQNQWTELVEHDRLGGWAARIGH